MRENFTRRSFLKGVSSAALSGMCTAPFSVVSGVPAIATGTWLAESLFEVDKEELEEKLKSEKQTVHLRSKNENFLNIGVSHDSDLLPVHLEKTFLGQAIQEADIVLLEHPRGDYFGLLKTYAEKLGKQVVNIDTDSSIRQGMSIIASLWAGFRAVQQLDIDFVGIGLSEEEKYDLRKEWITYLLKTFGISELGIFPPTLLGSILKNRAEDPDNQRGTYDAKHDISFTGDGRTVFMVLDTLKVMKENPNKKIVVVTGDVHATGINYYLNEAEGQLKLKEIIYNMVYGWVKFLPF